MWFLLWVRTLFGDRADLEADDLALAESKARHEEMVARLEMLEMLEREAEVFGRGAS